MTIQTETLTYQAGTVTAKSTLYYDAAQAGKRPGVLIFPEWWGVGEHLHERAARLAALGYAALVSDLYGDAQVTEDPAVAGACAGPLLGGDRAELRARTKAAFEQLKSNPNVDAGKIAAIGFCFGGSAALELARAGNDFKGAVSFHGGLGAGTAPAPKSITPKILVLHGAADPFVPAEQVAAFEKEMDAAHADWQLNAYSGVEHAFTNKKADTKGVPGLKYDAQADARSWQEMQDFFAEIFGK